MISSSPGVLARARLHAVRAALGLTLVAPVSALAQYRPPPQSGAERSTTSAEEVRLEASRALASGDKTRAAALHKKAVGLYLEALKQDPASAAAAAGLGASDMVLGDYANIAANLTPAAAAHPEDLDVVFPLGVAFFKLKRYVEAQPLLSRVSQGQRSDQFIVHYYLGALLLQERQYASALDELQLYLKSRPAGLAASDAQIYEYAGDAYLGLSDPARARDAFNRAQSGRAPSLSVQLGLASVLELEGRRPEARDALDALARKFPTAAEPLERLGRTSLAMRDLPRAESAAARLLTVDKSARAPLLMGDVRMAQSRAKEAEASYRSALALSPSLFAAQVSLARAVQAQGRSDEAVALIEPLTASNTAGVETWAAFGSLLRRAGRYQRAIDAHEHVIALAPGSAAGHVLLGDDHFATGEWDKAVDAYDAALKVEPKNATARHWLARALSHRAAQRVDANRSSDAVRDLRRAFDLERTPEIGRSLGAALLTQRDYAEARLALTADVALKTAGWPDYLLLGYAELGMGGSAARASSAFEEAARRGASAGPDAQRQIYVGYSLAKLEAGEFDLAIDKLAENARTAQDNVPIRTNLAFALLRRALSRLEAGDAGGAQKDLEAAQKLQLPRGSDVRELTTVVKGLLDVETGHPERARAAFASVPAKTPVWTFAGALPVLQAYVDYRDGRGLSARKSLQKAQRLSPPATASALITRLGRAIDRREGEQRYQQHELAAAQRALELARKDDPLNPFVTHNLACVETRKPRAKMEAAVQTWQGLTATVPEANLNLGIDAQERSHDNARAYAFYDAYLNAGGKSVAARQWRDRLGNLYGFTPAHTVAPVPAAGLAAPVVPAAPAAGAEKETP